MQFHIAKTLSVMMALVVAAAALNAQDGVLGNGNGNGNGKGKGKGGGGNNKVTICHKNRHTITVSQNAVPAHQAHGDSIGACDVTPSTGSGKGKGGLRPDGGIVSTQEN
jgi:hypothetical protein